MTDPDTTPGKLAWLREENRRLRERLEATRAVLAAVDRWLSRHGRRGEAGYTFQGLPAPEVGELAGRVREALGEEKP